MNIFHSLLNSSTNFTSPPKTFVFVSNSTKFRTEMKRKNFIEAHAPSIVMCGNVLMFLLCNVMCFHTHLHVLHAYCCCYSLEMKRIMFMGAHNTLNVYMPIFFFFLLWGNFSPLFLVMFCVRVQEMIMEQF